jgi:hypothetical protein
VPRSTAMSRPPKPVIEVKSPMGARSVSVKSEKAVHLS